MKLKFYTRATKTNIFSEDPVCEGLVEYGNIWPINDTLLPNNQDDCVNFRYDHSKAYQKVSNYKVNVRFRYPFGGGYKKSGNEGTEEIFAKLNGYQRIKLAFITKTTYFHKNPVVFIATFANVIFGLANIVVAIINMNIQNEIKPIVSNYSSLIQMQSEFNENIYKNPDIFYRIVNQNSNAKKIDSLKVAIKTMMVNDSVNMANYSEMINYLNRLSRHQDSVMNESLLESTLDMRKAINDLQDSIQLLIK